MMDAITTVSIPGKDDQGNAVNLRLEIPRTQVSQEFPRVPGVIQPNDGIKLDNPAPISIKLTRQTTGGTSAIFELAFPPGIGMQQHRHVEDEITYIVDGQFEVHLEERIYHAGPGSICNFTSNVSHGFYNVGTNMGQVITIMTPGGMEDFYSWASTITNPVEFYAQSAQHGVEFTGAPFIINTAGARMVQIMPGEFMMGAPESDRDAHPDEKPQHRVRLNKPFWMGMHQVTVGQFRKFVQESGYVTEYETNGLGSHALILATGKVEQHPQYTWKNPGFEQDDRHPVVCVSWVDANKFCEWLSNKEGRHYRLPTEAEWEYCCRAGTTTRFANGDAKESMREMGNIADQSLAARWIWNNDDPPFPRGTHLPPYAEAWDDGFPFTAPVGSFKPNAWGLYDMHGNVGEWCSDWYDSTYYESSAIDDPKGSQTPEIVDISNVIPGLPPRSLRMVRGGVWLDPALGCRSSDRQTHRRHTIDSAADIGFRIVWEM